MVNLWRKELLVPWLTAIFKQLLRTNGNLGKRTKYGEFMRIRRAKFQGLKIVSREPPESCEHRLIR